MKKWSDILPRPALQRASTLASKAQAARASATIYPPQSGWSLWDRIPIMGRDRRMGLRSVSAQAFPSRPPSGIFSGKCRRILGQGFRHPEI